MPSLTEFKTLHDFSGLKVWCDAEREARKGSFGDGTALHNVINKVQRGPDWTDVSTPTFESNILNGKPVFRLAAGDYWTEAYANSLRQEDLNPLNKTWLNWMTEGPITVMAVMRQTSAFANYRGWLHNGQASSHGWSLRTNSSAQWEFKWCNDTPANQTVILDHTPVQNTWYIVQWSWDGNTSGTMRIGFNQFYESSQAISLTNYLPRTGAYPYSPWTFGREWAGNEIDGGEIAMWAMWSGITPNEKAWDGLVRWAGTKYGLTLS
jgi:hypothetical protein